ncbi:YjbH domain-containing protein [Gammaproteobacteria bacterium]|nr:YjbH domain-containing protein [Gammaproteobacteria bacterium]
MEKKLFLIIAFVASSFCSLIFSSIDDYFPIDNLSSPSNYGNTGLLEIPNARFMDQASLRFSFSGSFPNEFTALTATPFSWLEATYRYVEIKNQPYGPSSYSGNQSYKDKSFDLKIKLLNEKYYLPGIALGLRDIAGTGLFSSEYVVATKSFGDFDITAGIGWGLLGSDNSIGNPLNSLHDSFKVRSGNIGLGGTFKYSDWLSGPAAVFGGVEYNLRKYGLKLIAEYDSSDPQMNPSNRLIVKNELNLGLNYHLSDSFQLGLSFDRGTNFRLSFSLKGNFYEDTLPKPRPKNVVSLNYEQKKKIIENPEIFYRSLNKSLQDEGIFIQSASLRNEEVSVAVGSNRFRSLPRMAGRSTAIVSALSPDKINKINIHAMNGDFEVATFMINRDKFDAAKNYKGSVSEILKRSELESNSNMPLIQNSIFNPTINFPEFSWTMSPALKHQIGGPEGFYLGQLFWKTDTTIKFRRNLSLYTSFGINLYDTFNNLINTSQSSIPHVRSDIQKYLAEGKNNLQRMQLEYMYSPFKDIYIRADFGLLEEMFGGIGGEFLYRPFTKNYALGFSLHRVKQRGYKQRFNFRKYTTTTSHASLYYDLPMGLNAQFSVGKYLAGDKGATLDLSRRFPSGFILGIFATKTDLSAEEFGEGSFDKGFYFSIPTSLFFSDFRTGNISFGLHPLTKDGGSFLIQNHSLFSILGDSNQYSIYRDWNDLLD